MRIVFWGKGNRAASCLKALKKIPLLLRKPIEPILVVEQSDEDPNAPEFVRKIEGLKPDLFVLAGYGKILKKDY